MTVRTILVVALALICGASAAVGVSQLRQPATGAPVETVPVVTASADVPRGGVLEANLVVIRHWPKALVLKDSVTKLEEATGRTVLVPLVQGEPLLESKLADKAAGRGLAALIPDGMRAFTIQTAHVAAGVGGFLLPGDRVDVLLTTSSAGRDDPTGGGATTTLLQNIQALAVGQNLEAPDSNKMDPKEIKSVTLLATPDQAAKLDLGMNKGILHLALRNPEDDREANTRPATMAQLRLHQEKPAEAETPSGPAPAEVQQPVAEIRTLRGSHAGVILVKLHR